MSWALFHSGLEVLLKNMLCMTHVDAYVSMGLFLSPYPMYDIALIMLASVEYPKSLIPIVCVPCSLPIDLFVVIVCLKFHDPLSHRVCSKSEIPLLLFFND